MIRPAPAASVTQAEIDVEQMIGGGDRFASIDRLSAAASAESVLTSPPSSPVWIRTADGWRNLNRGDHR